MFRFKEFSVLQDKSAMKVGTDAILLGSWAPFLPDSKRILDIGTGTGILSLMMAQRFPNAFIQAVEIEESAMEECYMNFQNSKWSNRLQVSHCPIQDFTFAHLNVKFDCIISNPPFFMETIRPESEERKLARNTQSLSYEELIDSVRKLLQVNGLFATIIPFQNEVEFLSICKAAGLYVLKKCWVKGTPESQFKRSLLCFSGQESTIHSDTVVVEQSRHQYTEEFIHLTKDFYLNF